MQHPGPIDQTTNEPAHNESPKEEFIDRLPEPSYSPYSWTGPKEDDEQNKLNEWNEEWGDWNEEEWTEDSAEEGWTDWLHVDTETEWWYNPEPSQNPETSPNPKPSASRAESEVRSQDPGPRPQEPVM